MRRVITFLLILIPFCGIAFPQTIITGTVLANDGKPMPVANVELTLPGDATPLKTVKANGDGKYTIEVDSDSKSTAARFSEIYEEMQDEQSAFAQAVNDYRKAGGDMQQFRYDRSSQIDSLQARIGRETDGLIRQELLLYYLELSMYRGTNYQIETLWEVLNSDSTSSPIWSLNPPLYNYLLMRVGMTGDEYQQHVDEFIRENPSAYARSAILFEAFTRARLENNDKKSEEYYKILTTQYADTRYGALAKQYYSPIMKVKVGSQVPDFSIPSLGDSSILYTNATFKGKYYMIDFWATWCGPCVMEMKYLDKGFDLLSVSLDESAQDVVKFRNGKWPMP